VRLHRLLGPAPPADTQAAKSISWWIGGPDLTVIAGEAHPQIAEMIAWAREHRESLAELNERG
jgi:hypothetical protein